MVPTQTDPCPGVGPCCAPLAVGGPCPLAGLLASAAAVAAPRRPCLLCSDLAARPLAPLLHWASPMTPPK